MPMRGNTGMNILKIENLTKVYEEKVLLNNINLSIEENDRIGLVGVNGTGNQPLLR